MLYSHAKSTRLDFLIDGLSYLRSDIAKTLFPYSSDMHNDATNPTLSIINTSFRLIVLVLLLYTYTLLASNSRHSLRMRLSNALFFAFATSPLAVSAAGTLGFALGFNNADGSCKSQADYEKDFDALKGVTALVRTYSSSNCNVAKNILPAAVARGFKVILGVWYDNIIH